MEFVHFPRRLSALPSLGTSEPPELSDLDALLAALPLWHAPRLDPEDLQSKAPRATTLPLGDGITVRLLVTPHAWWGWPSELGRHLLAALISRVEHTKRRPEVVKTSVVELGAALHGDEPLDPELLEGYLMELKVVAAVKVVAVVRRGEETLETIDEELLPELALGFERSSRSQVQLGRFLSRLVLPPRG